jgi:hypothetical protein
MATLEVESVHAHAAPAPDMNRTLCTGALLLALYGPAPANKRSRVRQQLIAR